MLTTKENMDKNKQQVSCSTNEEIVISGIAGRFPKSDNMKHLQENFFNEIDLASEDNDRWNSAEYDMPSRLGKINNIEKFDAQYFDISSFEADVLDPMTRMSLEHTYEAIIDAGVNPDELRGTNTGVFVGVCFSATFNAFLFTKPQLGEYIFSSAKFYLANKISSWLDISGPSYIVDTACSSSLFALAHAYTRIQDGECNAAIVVGANLCLHPFITHQFFRLGVLSVDGYCRPFDKKASGYMRSDTIAVVFLQKAKDAKRIYATCVNMKTNCDGFKEEGIMYPSVDMQKAVLEEVYKECGIAPSEVSYMEAHGTGTEVGDPVEVKAIDHVLCKNRNSPLLMGSVKSNLGHSEPASGLCQIAKILIAMETGKIPANLHFKSLRNDLTAVLEGRIKIVSELTPWNGGYAGVNSFGFGGANCHLLLKWNPKDKIKKLDDLPRLVIVSGRTEEAVKTILDDVNNRPIDVEYIALLHCIYNKNIEHHPYRGYAIFGSTEEYRSINNLECDLNINKQICFLFPGTNVIWRNIGKELMKLPIFVKTIQKCDAALKPHGLCVTDILLNEKEITCIDIIKSFVAIISIQIAMVDLLLHIGIVPDYIIGESIGELVCGYVSELFTVEETILMAYYTGVAFEETKIKQCNYNSTDSNQYLEHTRLNLLDHLNQILSCKFLKSCNKKWLNKLPSHKKTHKSFTQLSIAEYYAYSVVYSIPLEELLPLIPKAVTVIEIISYDTWQFFANKFVDSNYISLFKHGQRNNIDSMLEGIGNLYNIGFQPQVANLYPPIQFPVGRGTPMISPLIKWNHSEDRFIMNYMNQKKPDIRELTETITTTDSRTDYMINHVIDGRILLPAAGYLFFIWKMIATLLCRQHNEIPIVFEDVNFLRATHLSTKGVKLTFSLQRSSNKFEIIEEDAVIVTGKVWILNDVADNKLLTHILNEPEHDVNEYMKTKDIYKELRLRGYQYSGLFRALKSASITAQMGHISWSGNWVAFIDNMLQMKILTLDSRSLFVPTRIRKVVIDPKSHIEQIQNILNEKAELPVRIFNSLDVIRSGGIEIYGVMATSISRRQVSKPIHEEYHFIAHCDRAVMSLMEIIQMSAHISLECNPILQANFIELIEDIDEVTEQDLLSTILCNILNNLPLIRPNVILVATANRFEDSLLSPNIKQSDKLIEDEDFLMIIVFKLLTKTRSELIDKMLSTLKEGSFLLSRENLTDSYNYTLLQQYKLNIVLEKRTEKEAFVLLRKTQNAVVPREIIRINNSDFSWIDKLKSAIDMDDQSNASARTIVVADDFECGILGFINCLRKELNKTNDKIRCVFIQDKNAPEFSLQDSVYMNQLNLDLPINILRPNKVWGSYRHLPLPPPEPKFVQHGYVSQSVRGDLSTLRWIEGQLSPDYKQENLIRVIYASLNFKDVVVATGRIPLEIFGKKVTEIDSFLGCEFVGFNAAGQRIMGISTEKGITNLILADPHLTWTIPDNWTFEDAATIPIAYSTSCYALYTQGKLKKEDTILIHSGTGAVGQSAIYLALFEGCEVFTTVGTPEKRKFIREKFPSIPENHIGNSRDTSFEQMISQQTKGRGVDIVLNSLAEDKLQASIRCLARGGRFLEIGKYDLMSNNTINLEKFSRGISFYGIMLDKVFISTDETRKITFHNSVSSIIRKGAITPLVREVFKQHEVETAFRHMIAAKHIGKVIIKIRDEEEFSDVPILAYPQYYCIEHKSYIIVGGLGGFGLELTDWLVLRGARNIVLISRTGIRNGYQRSRVELWKSSGCNVQIMTGFNASTHEDCAFILRSANALGPIDAIFNLAVVLKDGTFTNQTPETFEETFQSKALATEKLDDLSRKMCPHLRHFVVFSSVSCGKGNPGQTNYGMANSIMERICERRVQDGLPGTAIQWGAIGDVGLVAEMQHNNKELVISGTLQQRISSCLESLNTFLTQSRPIVSSMIVAAKSSTSGDIVHVVMEIMGLKTLKRVGENMPLTELGMDSMTGLEIKQTVEREFNIFLTAQEIRNLTFAKLKEIANKNKYEQKQIVEKQFNENNSQDVKVGNFFRLISNLDLISNIYVELPTQREIGRNEVFLLPGIEGFASIYKKLALKIKAPAICLQHSSINLPESVHSIIQSAADLLPHILSKLTDSMEFVIGGYSYGSLIAIEIVKQLESKNFRGRLVLIDGSPNYLKDIQETHFPFTNSQQFQDIVLQNMIDVFNISELIISELSKYATWEEKLNILTKNINSEITNTVSIESIKIFCTTIYKHLIAVKDYDTSSMLSIKSPIILLKATTPLLSSMEEDYGLNKISQNVQVHYVESTHTSIINSDLVADAINGEIKLEDNK